MGKLPEQFAALEIWTEWCLATETERNLRRVGKSFEEISAFAEAMIPHVEAICAYIDAHETQEGHGAESLNLFYLLLSLAEVAPAIESYDPEVEVVNGYETRRFVPTEKHRLRPAI